MDDPFLVFLRDPTAENFLAVRQEVITHADYSFYSDGLDQLTELCEQQFYEEVPDHLRTMMPNWLLTPRVHMYAAMAADARGDTDEAELERLTAYACLQGIRASGDGTHQKPYLVTHSADEDDLMEFLQWALVERDLIEEGDRILDCVRCQSGREVWFDISPSRHDW